MADTGNFTIRRITLSTGQVATLVGSAGLTGTTNGTGTAARFSSPYALTIDATNTIYVADYGNCMLRKITSAAAVTTAVGTAGTCRFTDSNAPGTINTPMGITKQGTTVHLTAGNSVGGVVNIPLHGARTDFYDVTVGLALSWDYVEKNVERMGMRCKKSSKNRDIR